MVVFGAVFVFLLAVFQLTNARLDYQRVPLNRRQLDDALTLTCSICLSFVFISSIFKIRRKIQELYLEDDGGDCESAEVNSDQLATQTLLLTGMENFDLSGDDFRILVKQSVGTALPNLGIVGFTILPALKKPYRDLLAKHELLFLRGVFVEQKVNCISRFLLPKKVENDALYAKKMFKLTKKIESHFLEGVQSSGYAFLLFQTAQRAIEFKQSLKKYSQKPAERHCFSSQSTVVFPQSACSFAGSQLAKLLP